VSVPTRAKRFWIFFLSSSSLQFSQKRSTLYASNNLFCLKDFPSDLFYNMITKQDLSRPVFKTSVITIRNWERRGQEIIFRWFSKVDCLDVPLKGSFSRWFIAEFLLELLLATGNCFSRFSLPFLRDGLHPVPGQRGDTKTQSLCFNHIQSLGGISWGLL
jgi:hypothetical protein